MEKLFSEFTSITAKQWQEKIIKDLKGKDLTELDWHTNNDILVKPFYNSESTGLNQQVLFKNGNWDICANIVVDNEAQANREAIDALSKGASGIVFYIFKKINTASLIQNISLEHIYSQFFISNDALHVLTDLKHVYGHINSFDHKMKCFVTIDPLGMLAYFGEWHESEEADLGVLKQLKHIPINASLYQEAGANQVNELAITLAHCNEYFHYLNTNQQLINKQIHVGFSIGGEFFTEIAKLRAFRKLIELLQKQYNTHFNLHIYCQTSLINKSEKDAYNNLLRSTTEAMSAIIGGCDSLSVLPYDEMFNEANEFASRIAINQQHILKDESYLNKVADISSGSYYIESLTNALAEKAWEQFKQIESTGGYVANLKSNYIQDLITNDYNLLSDEYKENKKTLLGVNKFVNSAEKVPLLKTNEIGASKALIERIIPKQITRLFS